MVRTENLIVWSLTAIALYALYTLGIKGADIAGYIASGLVGFMSREIVDGK